MNVEHKNTIIAKDFGHSDILDYPWGKIMHQTFSEGLKDRDESKIETYHNWLATIIGEYIKYDSLIVDSIVDYELKER